MAPWEFTFVFSVIAGFTMAIGGTLALFLKRAVDQDGESTIDIKYLGRLKTKYPALVALFLGTGLLIHSQINCPQVPPKIPVNAIVKKDGQPIRDGLVVIYRNGDTGQTNDDGTCVVNVDREGYTFAGFAYKTVDGKLHYGKSGVKMDDKLTKGTFEADITER